MKAAVFLLKPVSVAFFSSDTCCDSSFPPRCGVLITVNTRMWQGAAPGDLKGVMKGASGQEPQEGGLLVVLPCYLCRGHGGHLHQLMLASSHT